MLNKPIIKLSNEFDEVLKHLENTNDTVFVTGRAGTGKSTLLQTFRNATQKNVVVLAPTGVSALNVQGQTVHSFFGFPPRYIPKTDIKPRRAKALYQKLDTIIIDEISMVRADMLDNIDFFLRMNGKQPEKPFGGVQMIFFGDLFQLPPVVASPEEHFIFQTEYKSPYFFSAHIFKAMDLKTIELHTIYRQTDRHFIRLLDDVRSAMIDEDTLDALNERYDEKATSEDEAFITLSARNQTADEMNKRKLESINEPILTYIGKIEGEFNDKLCPADQALQLKVGAQVMFVRNDNKEKKYVNGTLGTVEKLTNESIEVLTVDEKGRPNMITVEKATWETLKYDLNEKGEVQGKPTGSFTQYPLRLAWAITIHKSQGKTFDRLRIDLSGGGAFEHGQTYVALSRCRTLGGITLAHKLKPKDIILDSRVVDFHEQSKR
jgi:ATP-dependent DNA helicase PIF1